MGQAPRARILSGSPLISKKSLLHREREVLQDKRGAGKQCGSFSISLFLQACSHRQATAVTPHTEAYAGNPCHPLRGAAMTPAAPLAGLGASRLDVLVTTATSSLEAGAAGRRSPYPVGPQGEATRRLVVEVTRGGPFFRHRLGFPFAVGRPASSLVAVVAMTTRGRGAA